MRAPRRSRRRPIGEQAAPPRGAARARSTGVVGELAGQVAPADIPPSAGFDVAALKDGDANPLEVVVAVPAATSARKWRYTPAAMQQIVHHVQQSGLAGFLGHQRPERVGDEFPTPVTHWVGAVWRPAGQPGGGEQGTAYFRGVVDPGATDLKRWLRAKTIRQVSIFGTPTLGGSDAGGVRDVVGYAPLSLDWTPLGRAGMPTSVVGMGEQRDRGRDPQDETEEDEMTLAEVLAELRRQGAKPAQVVGEMGWTREAVGEALPGGGLDVPAATAALAESSQVRTTLALPANAPTDLVLGAIRTGMDSAANERKRAHVELVGRLVDELCPVASGRPLVRRLAAAALSVGADEAQIRSAVTDLLAADDVRATLDTLGAAAPTDDAAGAAPPPEATGRGGKQRGEIAGQPGAGGTTWPTPRPAADNRAPAGAAAGGLPALPAGASWTTTSI